MKNQFLKELNHELKRLTKDERKKSIDDYEEIILDKMENGMTEENAVYSLGDVKQIAEDIISSYEDLDEKKEDNYKKFSIIYPFVDICIIGVSYLLAYYLCLGSGLYGRGNLHLSFGKYMFGLVFIIPGYLVLYYFFKAYITKYIHGYRWEMKNIFWANLVGIIIFLIILYLFNIFEFSRIMVLTFWVINILLEFTMRNSAFWGLMRLCKRIQSKKYNYF